jgi:hypothetical protein
MCHRKQKNFADNIMWKHRTGQGFAVSFLAKAP